MSRSVVWFFAGMMATVLVLGGVLVGATQFGDDAEAQGTWQVKLIDNSPHNPPTPGAGLTPNPDRHVDDWIVTLPDNCDILLSHDENMYFYRCPD